jgi:hypothetical protein
MKFGRNEPAKHRTWTSHKMPEHSPKCLKRVSLYDRTAKVTVAQALCNLDGMRMEL